MTITNVPDRAVISLDTNVVIYALTGLSAQCEQILQRCADGKVQGVFSVIALAEFCHRRMTLDAQSRHLAATNPAAKLAEHPEIVKSLVDYSKDVTDLLDSKLTIATLHAEDFATALNLQKQFGLMTNDSLIVASAKRMGISKIVTNDAHFDTLPGFDVL